MSKFDSQGLQTIMTMISNYITPITKIHSTFAGAKEYNDKYGGFFSLIEREDKLSIETLAQGKRNLIVGEPGVGKSLLLEKLNEYFENECISTALISLREPDALQKIDKFLDLATKAPKTLLLDGLDEVKSSLFPSVMQKIEELSAKHTNLPVFLAGRWVFISRYANSFPDYRFITISPFTRRQVREYLKAAGRTEADIDALLNRIMSFSHRMLVIQIPRYLSYLNDFLEQKGCEAASQVSRNELFEYFIYQKLELEENKINENKRAITKRLLEKLALTMEIYHTNVITKDELMTFFDELKSDLKLVALSQIGIEVLYEYSLLKVSRENIGKIEFENTEFQEYLAAKEITRFPDPKRTAFEFAVDPDTKEIYPTWYNTLTFLVDMQQNLLEQLVEFSGLRADKFKVLDEAFFTFLSRVNPNSLNEKLRCRLFKDVVEYYERTMQWLPGQLSHAMPGFYNSYLEPYLKEMVEAAEQEKNSRRFIPLGNLSYIVADLLRNNNALDRPYWRGKLISYASDENENGVLQRRALTALQFLGDQTVIDELPDLIVSEELIRREFLSMCTELAPDHPKSLEYFFDAIKRDEIFGRYGLFALRQPKSIKKFLKTLIDDEIFRNQFMNDSSLFEDQDRVLVENIEHTLDDETRELSKEVLVKTLQYDIAYNDKHSEFINGLWKFLRKDDPEFVTDMVGRLKNTPDSDRCLYVAQDYFAQVIEKEDVEDFIKAMHHAVGATSPYNVMLMIKFSKREGAEEIYEAGRTLLEEEYLHREDAQSKESDSPANKRIERLLHQFHTLLEPEPGKYIPNVFKFYNHHAQELDPLLTQENRERIIKLLEDEVLKKIDPGKHGLTITKQQEGYTKYTTSMAVRIFGDAIMTAKHLGFDTMPYRQQILNYIPFAYDEELKTIFDLVKDINPGEMRPVIEVYHTRHTDLWQHNPVNLIHAVEQYHVTEAAPVLKAFIMESALEIHVRRQAIPVLDSIAPDADFLRQVLEKYKDSADYSEKELAHIANGLLIKTHADGDAIRWRLRQVVERSAAVTLSAEGDIHNVSNLIGEILFDKTFAKPLMELKSAGYEKDYCNLLDEAMEIWAKGKEFHEYAGYLWGIVYAYFDNLKEKQNYMPLQMLEEKIAGMQDREGANWLAGQMSNLRRSYLTYLGKLDNISQAIVKYNDVRDYDDKKIRNASDLFKHVLDALDVELRQWIEDEGAYKVLGKKIADSGVQEYEKLVQKTLKPQIENILIKRGYDVNIIREPQLLDEKRPDFLVYYGFVGPIVIEIKLTSNKDLKGKKLEQSTSYASMGQYMRGYGASHGIFLVINNVGAKNLSRVTEAYQKIKGVKVLSFACLNNQQNDK